MVKKKAVASKQQPPSSPEEDEVQGSGEESSEDRVDLLDASGAASYRDQENPPEPSAAPRTNETGDSRDRMASGGSLATAGQSSSHPNSHSANLPSGPAPQQFEQGQHEEDHSSKTPAPPRPARSSTHDAQAPFTGPSSASQQAESTLVEMSPHQYQAFLSFQRLQQSSLKQSSSSIRQPQVERNQERVTPIASTGAIPAFTPDPRGGGAAGAPTSEVVVLHTSSSGSSGSRGREQPPPKRPSRNSPTSATAREEGTQQKNAQRSKQQEVKSPLRGQHPPVNALYRCPTCGSLDKKHDIMGCALPKRTDLTPSLSQFEINFLVKLDQIRRDTRNLSRDLTKEDGGAVDEDEDEEEESLGSHSQQERSEDEEEDQSDRDFLHDSESSYRASSQSTSVSASRSKSSSADRPLVHFKRPARDSTAERLERVEQLLSSLGERLLGGPVPPSEHFTTASSSSDWKTPEGMVGVPEIKREDLLKLPEFETLEKKYTDYCDRAMMHKRKPQPIAQCFGKFLPDIKLSINSLLSRNETVRRKFRKLLEPYDYKVTEQLLNDMSTQQFSDLYRELVTTRTFMASELITHLMETPFQRMTEGSDKATLTAIVIQASSAFRERLEASPTQTVKRCTPIQFRDAFVKMVLGNDDRNLADFTHCATWDEAAGAMLDMEGTGHGVTFLKKVTKGKSPARQSEEFSQPRHDKSQSKQSAQETDWDRKFAELSKTIEANETEMRGHTKTARDKVKRLLQLRDSRHREAELLHMEKGEAAPISRSKEGGGGAAAPYHGREQHYHSKEGGGGAAAPYHGREQHYHSNRDQPPSSHRDQRHSQSRSPGRSYGYDQRQDQRHFDGPPSARNPHTDTSWQNDQAPRRYQSPRSDSPSARRDEYSAQQAGGGARPTHQEQGGGAARQPQQQQTPSRSQMAPAQSTQRKCYNCGGNDHLSRECPKIGYGADGGARRSANHSRSPGRENA
jgi:hypothetical protein